MDKKQIARAIIAFQGIRRVSNRLEDSNRIKNGIPIMNASERMTCPATRKKGAIMINVFFRSLAPKASNRAPAAVRIVAHWVKFTFW